ncbi:MAG: ATP-binding protein [Polyangiales bacterium]
MGTSEREAYRFHDFELDAPSAELRRGGEPVKIFPRAFALLLYLVRHRERIVPREELLGALWPDVTVTQAVLTQTVWELRKALGDTPDGLELIRNSRGRGYRFAARLELVQSPVLGAEPASEPPPGRAFIPSGLRPKASLSVVGRELELQRLDSALGASLGGHGALVLLGGEPGIGKTRVAEELLLRARERKASVYEGRCYEERGGPPFWPWLQIVRRMAEETQPADLREQMGVGASDLCRFSTELGAMFPDVPLPPSRPADQDRFFMLDSVTSFFVRASQSRPLVLLLDDLHWADRASLLLLELLSSMVQRARILIVGTYRTTEVDAQRPLAQSLPTLAKSAEHVLLSGLSATEVSSLVSAETRELAPALALEVHHVTAGNPLFALQIARLLGGDERNRKALADGTLTLPDEVREVIVRRVAQLPPACAEMLRWAAALGQRFRWSDLRQVAERNQDELLGLLQVAVDARIVCEERLGLYRFSHPLIREGVHQAMAMAERARRHNEIGSMIEAGCEPGDESRLDELAYHFGEAAAIFAPDKAVLYAERAAARAFEATAYETAAEYYERALRALDLVTPKDVVREAELRLLRGQALRGAHEDPAKVRAVFLEVAETAKARGDAALLARAALGYSGLGPLRIRLVREAGTVDPVEVALLEQALAALPEGDSVLRALSLGQLANALYNSRERARREQLADAAVAMARRVGDSNTLAEALLMKQRVITAPHQHEERLALMNEILAHTQSRDLPGLELDGYVQRAFLLLQSAQLAAAEADIARALRLAEQMQQSDEKDWVQGFELLRMFWQGRFAEAEAESTRLADKHTRGGTLGIDQGHAIRMLVSGWQQGRGMEVVQPLAALAERYPLPVVWRCGLASMHVVVGMEAEARRELERLAVHDFEDLPYDHNWLSCHMYLSVICYYLGDRPRAELVHRALEPYAERIILLGHASMYMGPVHHALARVASTLERWDEADRCFERAIARNQELGARVWVAQVQFDYAETLWKRGRAGDRERARALIDASLLTARELGIGDIEQRAARLVGPLRLVAAGASE